MNFKKDEIDRIFANASDVVTSTHQVVDAAMNAFGPDANSRRNAYGIPNAQNTYANPMNYGYGYSDGVPNAFGGTVGLTQSSQSGYPGFYNPAYGNGGMW